jgi:hypothetical protein
MAKKPDLDDSTLRVMGALVRMPPKHHDEMKIGRPRGKPPKSRRKKEASIETGVVAPMWFWRLSAVICAATLTSCGDNSQRQRELAQRDKELGLMNNMTLAGPEIERRLRERIQSNGSTVVIKESIGDIFLSLRAMPAGVTWTADCSSAGLSVSFGTTGENGNGVVVTLSDAYLEEDTCKELIPLTAAKVTQLIAGK